MADARKNLVPPSDLRLARDNYAYRSELIEQLDTVSRDDPQRYEKQVLAFWLGSNMTLPDLERDAGISDYVYIGYYLMLAFDKWGSLIGKQCPELHTVHLGLLHYFNEHYAQLTEHPDTMFQKFYEMIANLYPSANIDEALLEKFNEFKRTCIIELSRVLGGNNEHTRISRSTPGLMEIDDGYSQSKRMTSFISARGMGRRLFFKEQLNDEDNVYPRACKLLLPAKDGTILEGVYFKQQKTASSAVTLISVGPFQPEFLYDRDAMLKFLDTFGTDVVFVSHRNHSVRSARLAQDIPELASDFTAFANHFRSLGMRVGLYGMCGGGPAMIMAAKELTDSNAPCKLILDRTYDSYIRLCGSKNAAHFDSVQQQVAPEDIYSYYFLKLRSYLYMLPWLESWQNDALATIDLDLAEVVRSLPEFDVLTLEAKTTAKHKPVCEDKFIGRDINIRRGLKGRRHEHKQVLKELAQLSQYIADELQNDKDTAVVFNDLRHGFQGCINLIDAEKLRIIGQPKRVMEYRSDLLFSGMGPFALANEKRLAKLSDPERVQDIHTEWLFTLTTRDTTPVGQLVNGFFADMPKDWADPFHACQSFSNYSILLVMEKLFSRVTHPNVELVANKVAKLLVSVCEHKDYLINISQRANATGLSNLAAAIRKLNNSELMRAMQREPYEVSCVQPLTSV